MLYLLVKYILYLVEKPMYLIWLIESKFLLCGFPCYIYKLRCYIICSDNMGARDWSQVYKVVICTVNARGKVGFSHYKKPTLCT